MNNKEQIKKLRDNAELAWAAYGYFHLADKEYKHDDNDKERLKEFKDNFKKYKPNDTQRDLTYTDILDITYKYYLDKNGKPQDSWYHKHFLGGDFSPIQAQRFFERYDLLIHQPNTESGFSATLFQNKETKEYTLAIRGTEFKLEQIKDLINDYYIGTNSSDMNRVIEQYFDMLLFYEETLKPLLQEKGITKINITGHSLGGYLAQRALIYCDSLYKDKLKFSPSEVYTFNASLESRSVA